MKPEERKIKAIELLKKLDIYEPYIEEIGRAHV